MSSQNAYVEALTPAVMVFGDGAFGGQLGLDEVTGWGPHDGISAPLRRNTRGPALFLSPSCEDTARGKLSISQEESEPTMLTP